MQKSSWGGWVVMEYQVRSQGAGQVNGRPGTAVAATPAILPVHGLPVAWFSWPV